MDKIEELNKKLDRLQALYSNASIEIDELRVEILRLKIKANSGNPSAIAEEFSTEELDQNPIPAAPKIPEPERELAYDAQEIEANHSPSHELGPPNHNTPETEREPKKKINFEKLIGENLINKIGILITVIGVGIGAKYSIDNDLISPLTRIILGYVFGIGLLGVGMKLKEKYTNYSAVLVSGAMAIMYFITYFAFDFYSIISQGVAFGLMVIFTIFTVIASLNFDKQIIAHFGLVGAVAVPFLLSDGSGNQLFMFSYMLLICIGVFVISLKKNWKFLFYSIFGFTWLIYSSWVALDHTSTGQSITLALGFLCVYFLLFYAIFVTYKLLNKEQYRFVDIAVLLLNSAIFFGIGYYILESNPKTANYLGLFAIVNAVIHFVVARLINKKDLADKNLFYLVIGLVLVFLTVAIPLQLDGNYVTIMWACEAALLFWIGRTKNVAFYEYISYAMIGITLISLKEDWMSAYYIPYNAEDFSPITPLLNSTFLTSLVALVAVGFINWISRQKKHLEELKITSNILEGVNLVLPLAFLYILYFALYEEIGFYFDQLFENTAIKGNPEDDQPYKNIRNYDINKFKTIWLINYTIVFITLLCGFIYSKMKSEVFIRIGTIASLVVMLVFMVLGLYEISELREIYIRQYQAEYYNKGMYYLWIRYVSIGLFGVLAWFTYKKAKVTFDEPLFQKIIEIAYAVLGLWLLSSELIHWLDLGGSSKEYGLGLSILWGVFSALIIAFGIWKKKKHLRILGIAIFGFTLIKLFFYDLANLSTISKTIVLVSLGILLLGTSFLYNKYTIEDEN